MMTAINFGIHSHRCLFRNDCVEAHLLGLKPECPCFEARFTESTTLIVTFGCTQARYENLETTLTAGDQVQVPESCLFSLTTSSEADVMLLLKPTSAQNLQTEK